MSLSLIFRVILSPASLFTARININKLAENYLLYLNKAPALYYFLVIRKEIPP